MNNARPLTPGRSGRIQEARGNVGEEAIAGCEASHHGHGGCASQGAALFLGRTGSLGFGVVHGALLPGWMWPVADLAETLTTPLSGLIALRALITLERPLRGPVSVPVSHVMGSMFTNPAFTLAAT